MTEAEQNLTDNALHAESGRTGTLPESGSKTRSHPLLELTLARMREFWRQPEAVFWVFVFPVLLAFALGIAFRNTAPEKMRIAVESSAANAQEIAAAIARAPDLQPVVMSPAEASQALRTGKVALVVQGGIQLNGQGSQPGFDLRFDPTRPESQVARRVVNDALQRAAGRADIVVVRDQNFTEPGARYIDFLIPGLIGLNLMGSGMWGLGFAIVQARKQRLLKRLAATPMRRWHFLLSFMLSRLAFLGLEVAAILAFAYFVFNVKVHGSLLNVTLVALLGSMTFAGIGLLVAARTQTIEGASGLMNLVMLPMWLLSGSFFSATRFPEFLQPLIKALPLTALNDSLRAVMNDGAGLSVIAISLVILLVWGLVSFIVALRIFRWQ
ncbi:MAG: ABC transporter permease [Acidobacteria bacterium]|nr:ABC transporter permease [Acidobacteriota bacterium]